MIDAKDPLNWYFDQLAGLEPETTPGDPKAGFYLLRRRIVKPNDDPNRRPGDSRNKVSTVYLPAHIRPDAYGWRLTITRQDGVQEEYSDTDTIDSFFSQMCRNAITEQEYQERVNGTYRENAA